MLLSGAKPLKEQLFLLSIQSKTGKTVNCVARLPLALWSSIAILSACTRRALANKRERGEERYLPENGGISNWGLQSRLWSRAAEARGRRAARLSYYATASLSLSAARPSTELFNEARLSHNVFCSWMSLSLWLDLFFHGHFFFFFTPTLHSFLFGHQSGKVWPLKNHSKS